MDVLVNHIMSKLDDKDISNKHIDHIKPISCFNLKDKDEFDKCCHYTNIQLIDQFDNLSISNKWNEIDEKYWNDNIIYNDKYKDIYFPVECKKKDEIIIKYKKPENNTDKNAYIMNYIRHQKYYKKILIEFKNRSYFPVHVYNTKQLFVDIRNIYQ